MEGKRSIQSLWLRNFLSYGDNTVRFDLEPLNVLIGPNGSGKSNILEACRILRASATDLASAFREGGGIGEYIWKGRTSSDVAAIHVQFEFPQVGGLPLMYSIGVRPLQQRVAVSYEMLTTYPHLDEEGQVFYFLNEREEFAYLTSYTESSQRGGTENRPLRSIPRQELISGQSILSQRRDPDLYPELTYLADQFGNIALFREWSFGQRTPVRFPQPTDLPGDFLLPDASNLALVLNDLMQRSSTRKKLLEHLREFYAAAQHIATPIQGGTVQLVIEEDGDKLVPAARLSDGTLRYLALLAILCHPTPPPMVCIEEPELGLHPDIIATIAKLLREASERTQLIVTTHSDTLVSALSEVPEAIVVCEPRIDGTTLQRLDRETMASWLEKYSLGEVWRMGGIGGNRW